jgi:hypothetical protein
VWPYKGDIFFGKGQQWVYNLGKTFNESLKEVSEYNEGMDVM